ncbi:hypothetical protein D3C72_1399890 [compost metagenome]
MRWWEHQRRDPCFIIRSLALTYLRECPLRKQENDLVHSCCPCAIRQAAKSRRLSLTNRQTRTIIVNTHRRSLIEWLKGNYQLTQLAVCGNADGIKINAFLGLITAHQFLQQCILPCE